MKLAHLEALPLITVKRKGLYLMGNAGTEKALGSRH